MNIAFTLGCITFCWCNSFTKYRIKESGENLASFWCQQSCMILRECASSCKWNLRLSSLARYVAVWLYYDISEFCGQFASRCISFFKKRWQFWDRVQNMLILLRVQVLLKTTRDILLPCVRSQNLCVGKCPFFTWFSVSCY